MLLKIDHSPVMTMLRTHSLASLTKAGTGNAGLSKDDSAPYNCSSGSIKNRKAAAVGRTSGLVLGANVEDAVGVHVEGDVDLGHAARRRRDAGQVELAQQVVVLRARALALEHLSERQWSVPVRWLQTTPQAECMSCLENSNDTKQVNCSTGSGA